MYQKSTKWILPFVFLLAFATTGFAGFQVNTIDEAISVTNQGKVRSLTEILNQAMTPVTGVIPTHEFDLYCDRLPYFGWSHNREFWNITQVNCNEEWFEESFTQQYSHEMFQLFFVHDTPGITDAIDDGIYDAYFSPFYVFRPDEHLSFALDNIFWGEKAATYGLTPAEGSTLPYMGYDIAADSEYQKFLSTLDAGFIHHTETNYSDFLSFSFYVGSTLFVKLHQHDPGFLRRYISSSPSSGSYESVEDYADAIISAFKAGGQTLVDGQPVEQFVWSHPDFRRFTEDYSKRYYFEIFSYDANKRQSTPWHKFFNFTRINPTNICFAGASFKNYTDESGVFDQGLDESIYNWTVTYHISDSQGRVVASGQAELMEMESSECAYEVPTNLPNGLYTVTASVTNATEPLTDSLDFVVNNNNNFYTAQPEGYNYLVLKNSRIDNTCYYLKLAYYEDYLKLEEMNEINCNEQSSSDISIDQGFIQVKNVELFGQHYTIKLNPLNNTDFHILNIQ